MIKHLTYFFCKAILSLLIPLQDPEHVNYHLMLRLDAQYVVNNHKLDPESFRVVNTPSHTIIHAEHDCQARFCKTQRESSLSPMQERAILELWHIALGYSSPCCKLSSTQIISLVNTAHPESRVQAVQTLCGCNKVILLATAETIQDLLVSLNEQNPKTTFSPQSSLAESVVPKSDRSRVIAALQAGGEAALQEVLDNSYVNIILAIIKGWQEG